MGMYCDRKNDSSSPCRVLKCSHGQCKISAHGEPYCECDPNYSGERCDRGWYGYSMCKMSFTWLCVLLFKEAHIIREFGWFHSVKTQTPNILNNIIGTMQLTGKGLLVSTNGTETGYACFPNNAYFCWCMDLHLQCCRHAVTSAFSSTTVHKQRRPQQPLCTYNGEGQGVSSLSFPFIPLSSNDPKVSLANFLLSVYLKGFLLLTLLFLATWLS